MLTIVLVLIAALATGSGVLALAVRHEMLHGSGPDIVVESESWRPVNAEVISVLRAGSRTFLRVRYSVGTRLIDNDVVYPLAGPTPEAGRRVPLRYDPAAPARAVYDHRRTLPGPAAPTSDPVRNTGRKPLTPA
ncbi:MAG TPA: DUF3592 domain-containing protein [Kribbellaceae bacterium]|nr:DUF3592 domain-containing protein [Kribbellaceae bacterium]